MNFILYKWSLYYKNT